MTTASAVLVQPNVFELAGYGTQISYATTSFTGVPELTYVNRGVTLKFRGDQIRNERTSLGQMVTVSLNSNPQAIGPVESLSVLIPSMSVAVDTRQGAIQTIAILSLRSIPAKHPAQSQEYMPLCLSGTARQLDF